MPWWRRRDWSTARSIPATPATAGADTEIDLRLAAPRRGSASPNAVEPVSSARVAASLKRLDVRHLVDEEGNLLAMWERHVVLFALEGPDADILVVRARAYSAVPPEWADRAYAAINEWNCTRRFLKAYVGDETESGKLSLYAEMQLPLAPGLHDELLDELVDCAAAVSGSWSSWLHDEGALL
ncbi:MAG: YbjN domain-containing protein [Micromonosporaceae bacterium]